MDFDNPRLLELLRTPAEDLAFEIKEWLSLSNNTHKAKLAQAMIALANHGGGAVLIGYAEQGDGSFIPAEPRPADLSGYTSDVINERPRGRGVNIGHPIPRQRESTTTLFGVGHLCQSPPTQ
jgi:hypothetical protein